MIDIPFVFGFSASELFLVGLIFFLVLAAPRIGKVGELLARVTSSGGGPDPRDADDKRVVVREKGPPTEG